jgi:hypothetical protein
MLGVRVMMKTHRPDKLVQVHIAVVCCLFIEREELGPDDVHP